MIHVESQITETAKRPVNVGDAVRHRSSPFAPVMVVNALEENESMAICLWFDDQNQLQEGKFAVAALEHSQ